MRDESAGADFLVTTTPLFDESGAISGCVHVARDITESKRMEIALRESEERVHQALEAGRMYTFEWNLVSDNVILSPQAKEILRVAADGQSTSGQAFYARLPKEDSASLIKIRNQLQPSSTRYTATYRFVRLDGSIVYLEENARGFFDKQ